MNYKKLSHKLSKILRHELNNINHDDEGYVSCVDIKIIIPGINSSIIKHIENNDSKNRFHTKLKNNILYIRANQGHSSGNLNDDKMLELISEPLVGCFHGTYKKYINLIFKNGLSKMKRRHIHIVESDSAISGKRKSANIKIYIKMKEAMDDGYKFYRSANGVILTPGNQDGILPPKYFYL